MIVLGIILCFIVPIFCQPGPSEGQHVYDEFVAKLQKDILVERTWFSRWSKPIPIYPHSFENCTRRGYTRLKAGDVAKVVIAKLGIQKAIIGLVQGDPAGTMLLVPFVEYAPYPPDGIERLKMELREVNGRKSGEAFELLDQKSPVHPLFFEPIDKKYHFDAYVVEYKSYTSGMGIQEYERKFTKAVGTLPPNLEADRRKIYLQRYPDRNPRRIA